MTASNCFSALTEFEKAYLLSGGLGGGSVRQFSVFAPAIEQAVLQQMRAGFLPSFYEDNSLLIYYLLDGTDLSLNN